MKRFLLSIFVKLRWAYFHVNPNYKKFYMVAEEAHFWNQKTNTIHSNFELKDKRPSI